MIDFPELRFVAAGGSEVWEFETDFRHAGFVQVIDSPRRVGRLSKLVADTLDGHPSLFPSLRQQLWDRLPWSPGEVSF